MGAGEALQNVGTSAAPNNKMFLYANSGAGQFTSTKRTQINPPACSQSDQVMTSSTDAAYPCGLYDSNDWNTVQRIAGITDVTGAGGKPDLLVVTKDTCAGSTCATTTPSYDLWL